MMGAKSIFLTADWTDLTFLSFKIPDQVLDPYLPPGAVFDRFEDSAVASLVAFRFLNAKVLGVRPPFMHSFAELNLRFYVRERSSQLPGVVFIKEICPYYPVAWMAELFFRERFLVMPCKFKREDDRITYGFGKSGTHGEFSVRVETQCLPSVPGSASEFLVRRFHGFSKWGDTSLHYEVQHSPWDIHAANLQNSSLPFETWYPGDIAAALRAQPFSALYSPGSSVSLTWGSLSNAATGVNKGRKWNTLVRAS